MKTWSGIALALALCSSTSPAAEPQAEVSFADGILPILSKRCTSCHEGNGKKGGVDLSSYEQVMGKAGLVVPGSPDKSKLYTSVTGAQPKMPKGNGGPLAKAEVDAIAAWIKAGAKNPPPTRSG